MKVAVTGLHGRHGLAASLPSVRNAPALLRREPEGS